MTLVLQLTEAQAKQLRAKAAQDGKDPASYLLSIAGIDEQKGEANPQPIAENETNTAYDLFRGLVGGFAGGTKNLSENTGAAFGTISKRAV